MALILVAAGAALATDSAERPREGLSGGATDSGATGGAPRATLGQPVIGAVATGGGDVILGQGFWLGGSVAGGKYGIYLPLAIK